MELSPSGITVEKILKARITQKTSKRSLEPSACEDFCALNYSNRYTESQRQRHTRSRKLHICYTLRGNVRMAPLSKVKSTLAQVTNRVRPFLHGRRDAKLWYDGSSSELKFFKSAYLFMLFSRERSHTLIHESALPFFLRVRGTFSPNLDFETLNTRTNTISCQLLREYIHK